MSPDPRSREPAMTGRSTRSARWLRLASAAVSLGVSVLAAHPALAAPRLVRVPLEGGLTAQRLVDAGLDVIGVRGGACMLLVNPDDDARLASLGARPELVDADPGATAAARTRADRAAHPAPAGRRVKSAARPDGIVRTEVLPPIGSGSLGGFWNNAEVKMKLDDLVAGDTQDLVADRIDTLGYSRRHRPIHALTLGKPWPGPGPDPRPVVYLNALAHAREPEGMQTLLYWVDDLLARYPADPMAKELLEDRRIVICPVVNPDGYAINESLYVFTGSFAYWRKNARDNDNNHLLTSNDGVDLNRNFGYQWGLNSGSSGATNSETYRGPSAFSEPETQIQRDEVIALRPASGLSFHSFGDWQLHAWGYTAAATPDSAWWYRWDDDATRDNGYQSGQSTRVLYAVSGEFNDWVYGDTLLKPRGYTWTPEVGTDDDGFWPLPSRIVPIAQENRWRCDYTAAIAGPFVRMESASFDPPALSAGYFSKLTPTVTNVGLRGTGLPVHATLSALSPGASVLQPEIDLAPIASRTTLAADPSFTVALDDTVTPGRLIAFQIDFSTTDGHASRDTVVIPAGIASPRFLEDGGSGTGQWTLSGYGLETSVDTQSPYLTDSPSALYPDDMNRSMTTSAAIPLGGNWVHAYLTYRAKWDFESKYDGAFLGVSGDGVNFTRLASTGTLPSKGQSASPLGVAGLPSVIGNRHLWKTDRADLSVYAGPGAPGRFLRFTSVSDAGLGFDGLDVDDIAVIVYDLAGQPRPTAVDHAPAPALALAAPSPNPARGRTTFEFALPRASRVTLELFDTQGRRVRTLASGTYEAGRWVRGWDLADDTGRRVAAGLYLARLSTDAGARVRRVAVLW